MPPRTAMRMTAMSDFLFIMMRCVTALERSRLRRFREVHVGDTKCTGVYRICHSEPANGAGADEVEIHSSNIESPSPPRFSAGEKGPTGGCGGWGLRTVQSVTAPPPHSASLRVSLSPLDAGRGTLDRFPPTCH